MKVPSKIVPVLLIALLGKAISTPLENRIAGGVNAVDGQYPYQVAIGTSYNPHICGGAILNSYHVITAAHCFEDSIITRVRVGSVSLTRGNIQEYTVCFSIGHHEFNPVTMENDLAILKLNTPIKFSESVQPIALDSSYIDGNTQVVATGWGRPTLLGDKPDVLQQLNLTTVNNTYCQSINVDGLEKIEDSMLCTLTRKDEGMCYGDSGSPLAAHGRLVGIVSWSVRPCATGAPDVFTRVSSYIDWISATVF